MRIEIEAVGWLMVILAMACMISAAVISIVMYVRDQRAINLANDSIRGNEAVTRLAEFMMEQSPRHQQMWEYRRSILSLTPTVSRGQAEGATMGSNTKIEWTGTPMPDGTMLAGHTFNPWHGCFKVSPGCAHCYAETQSLRYGHKIWGTPETTERRMMSDAYWKGPLKWNAEAWAMGVRRKVFCASMADVFEAHPGVVEARTRLWALIEQTPWLDWLLLTKRPENIAAMLPPGWLKSPRPNVWLGTSAENQREADRRLPELLKVPAVLHFLSAEPLLGKININEYCRTHGKRQPHKLGWVIVGGESGADARPMHPEWATFLREYCQYYNIPFFFKQWGAWSPVPLTGDAPDPQGRSIMALPNSELTDTGWNGGPGRHLDNAIPMWRFPTKAKAGYKLEEKEYKAMPTILTAPVTQQPEPITVTMHAASGETVNVSEAIRAGSARALASVRSAPETTDEIIDLNGTVEVPWPVRLSDFSNIWMSGTVAGGSSLVSDDDDES